MFCRFLARKRGRPLSNAEIAKAAGIDASTVCKLSKLQSWSGVSVWLAEAFSKACGVDLLRPESSRRDKRLIINGSLKFLRRATHQQRRMYSWMLKAFGEDRRNVGGADACSNQESALSGDMIA